MSQGPWPGRFVWHDLMTTDAEKSVPFYTSLFDWQIQEVPMQGFTYRMILCGPGRYGFDAGRGWARRPFVGSAVVLVLGAAAGVAAWFVLHGTNPFA